MNDDIDLNPEHYLYHYTSLEKALELILPNKRLLLSNISKTLDPDEFSNKLFSMVGYVIPGKDEPDIINANILLNRKIHNHRLICFCSSEKPEIVYEDYMIKVDVYSNSFGWEKPRMWEQYASRHNGLCLIIDKQKLENHINKLKENNVDIELKKVKYRSFHDIRIDALALDMNKLQDQKIEDYVDEHIHNNRDYLFYEKNIDYRDESEYRVLLNPTDETDFYIDISEIIYGIIIGKKVNSIYHPLVINSCKILNCICYHLSNYNGRYLLEKTET